MLRVAAALLFLLATGAHAQQAVPVPACDVEQAPDTDADGVSDACELELARSFAPVLVVRSGGCNRDATSASPRLGGGYLFAVQRVSAALRIAYLPAYFRDCGWSGPKCWLPVNCAPHAADSEFIAIDVRRDGGGWSPRAVFLSAHCFGRSGQDCRWYRDGELAAFEWEEGAPVVWVAEGRQANYPTRTACDRGHHGLDTCDRHDARYRFPVLPGRNIGSRAVPNPGDGCVPGAMLQNSLADAAVLECLWHTAARFTGWQRAARGVTGYARYLELAGFLDS